ncbi:malate synthase A [Bdellovibrio sp. NC01]|uniref:malate synthase A n=1 Tax=Bdellovibrio sp. NC01 TaxID=2220073 RepID=UPI001158D800|nr:malate synthase A [Bdellovibrio sp. NC01]QDK36176.1 malate synthase A [Bdellovibrio sp. NC01]
MITEKLKQEIVTPEAAEFLISLHAKFDNLRRHFLIKRRTLAGEFAQGRLPKFLGETRSIREGDWKVADAPADLRDRRVEITGPAEPKMLINALNSGAKVFMADIEDSLSPSWENVLLAQDTLRKAVRRTLVHEGDNGKIYSLNEELATLVVRPRGLHLEEKNFLIRGQAISASLFDFGLYFFHNAKELIRRGSGPYFYLPKLENHEEAGWWNDVFNFTQDRLKIPRGTIRATVLIETITAAFEMEEILYVLKDHASGLNAGRWDYIFSLIKKFHTQKRFLLPDRALVTMNTSFMNAYSRLLVQSCHKRNAHAIGGMAAFIPNKFDPELNAAALEKVAKDKHREARMGFDGSWVAHPGLIHTAKEQFDRVFGEEQNQKSVIPLIAVTEDELLDVAPALGLITEEGVRLNINVSLLYLDRWLDGVGAAALHNLMEDAATAEISRSQLWQWLHHSVPLADGRIFSPELYHEILRDEVQKLIPQRLPYLDKAISLLNSLVLSNHFQEFLTLSAYEILNQIDKGDNDDLEFRAAIAPAGL